MGKRLKGQPPAEALGTNSTASISGSPSAPGLSTEDRLVGDDPADKAPEDQLLASRSRDLTSVIITT